MSLFPVRLASVACLATVVCACDNSRPSAPTSPTNAPAVSIPATGYTLSGAVTENGQPIVGANVNAFVQSQNFGYSYMWAHGAILTDANGGFRLPDLAAGVSVWMQVHKDGYVQQCAASSMVIQADATVNLQLVSRANLGASAVPSEPRTVSGVIVEMTATGKQPVAGAVIDFEPLESFPAAITYTDAAGRFALCGLPQNQSVNLNASISGRDASVMVPAGQTSVEITLP